MEDAPFVPVGRVVKVHGLNGEVSVVLSAGPPFSIPPGLEVWAVPPATGPARYVVESVRQGPKGPLVKLRGVDDRGAAEDLRGRTLMARSDELPEGWDVPHDEDIGLRVTDVERGDLGEVAEIIVTGANDVWVVRGERFGEVLVPVIDDVLVEVDDARRVALVRLLPGLLSEEASNT